MARRSWATTRPSTWRCSTFIDRFPDLQETPAQFQERCGQIALKCFWRDKAGPPLARGYQFGLEWIGDLQDRLSEEMPAK